MVIGSPGVAQGAAGRWRVGTHGLSTVYIDADACPVKDEVYRVAERYGLPVTVVTLPPEMPSA